MCRVIFISISPNEQRARGGGGGGGGVRCQSFYFYFFPYSADHEQDWPPCKAVFIRLATNTLNVRKNLQPLIPPKRFNIFPLTGGCSEGLATFRVFFRQLRPRQGDADNLGIYDSSGISYIWGIVTRMFEICFVTLTGRCSFLYFSGQRRTIAL